MKKYILAAAVAIATLGFAGKADAQVGYGYRTYNYNPYNGSYVTGQTAFTPFGAQNVRTFSNPYNGAYGQRSIFQDPYGGLSGSTLQYNPFTGLGYTSGFYNPGIYGNPYIGNPYLINPYAGYRYGFYFR